MADKTELPAGCGSKAGVLLVLIIAAMVAAVAYWAVSKRPPATPTPISSGTPPIKPAG